MVTSQHKQYSSQFLRQVNECSKTQYNFSHFWLRLEVRSNIINLGIRKYHQPYRRNRAGKHLFHRIHMVVTQYRKNKPNRSVNINNLASLKRCIVSGKVYTISGALLNCRSIVNKTQDLQVEIATNNYDLCALTETWIKEDDTLTSHRMCPPGYSVTSVPRTNRTWEGE